MCKFYLDPQYHIFHWGLPYWGIQRFAKLERFENKAVETLQHGQMCWCNHANDIFSMQFHVILICRESGAGAREKGPAQVWFCPTQPCKFRRHFDIDHWPILFRCRWRCNRACDYSTDLSGLIPFTTFGFPSVLQVSISARLNVTLVPYVSHLPEVRKPQMPNTRTIYCKISPSYTKTPCNTAYKMLLIDPQQIWYNLVSLCCCTV